MHRDLANVLFHETTILSRLDAMAREMTADYAGKKLTVVPILHGSLFFMADLLRRVSLPLQIDSLHVSSYAGTESTGTVTFNQTRLPKVKGRHVLLLDDILDTGRTLAAIREKILAECQPASVKICVLLRKRKKRARKVPADYVGFDIGDEFVVGYGLDYNEHYRNLPLIGVLKPSAIKPAHRPKAKTP
jgi:hypoxanthine phosphoribosyltransferase